MKRFHLKLTPNLYKHSFYALLIVTASTFLFLLVGRGRLDSAVITLLYLIPVVWSTAHWGKGPGMAAALSAALLLAYFFLPPIPNFAVGSLDDWLVLIIFVIVASAVVDPIQASLARAQASEREALLMYELSATLASARTQEAVAFGVARFLQRTYSASLVTVSIQPKGQLIETAAYEPHDAVMPPGKADRILAIVDTWGLAGEIQIWKAEVEISSEDSRLFQDFMSQIGQALERTHTMQVEMQAVSKVADDSLR